MKVAVCISGQPRSFEAGYEYLKKNLLDDSQADIFIHSWKTNQETQDAVYDLYKPKICCFEDRLPMSIGNKYPNIANHQFPAYNTISMWYSVFLANFYKRKWEINNDFSYDVVVRTRFDYALNRQIYHDFDYLPKGKIYVPNDRLHPDNRFCADMFAYGSSHAMDLYSNVYLNMDYIYDKGMPMNGEEMLSGNLQVYGLVGENMVYIDMNNPFPPGKYNGNWHSIIRDDFKEWNSWR